VYGCGCGGDTDQCIWVGLRQAHVGPKDMPSRSTSSCTCGKGIGSDTCHVWLVMKRVGGNSAIIMKCEGVESYLCP
jgi:hypothetical protein